MNNFLKNRTRVEQTLQKRYTNGKSLVISKMQIKTTVRYHYIPIKISKIQKTDPTKYQQGCRETGTHTLLEM